MNEKLLLKIKMLPTSPGVYVMLNNEGQVIYVGKAKILKNRVKQYFYQSVKTEKVMAMVSNIEDFYYIITASEFDALSLENNLIKKYKPKYNILLKDDKTYPYLKINIKEDFPAFEITRRIKNDKAKYFGPFMTGVPVKDVLEVINQSFMLRSCSPAVFSAGKVRACLNYDIKRCIAPCLGKIDSSEYHEKIKKAIDFLNGNDDDAFKLLNERMLRAAENEEFELALALREKLKILDKISQRKITSLNKNFNADIIAVANDKIHTAVNILFTRGGRMQGSKSFSFSQFASETTSETVSSFIREYYKNGAELPEEIILFDECEDAELIENYFKENANKKVVIVTPKQGVRKELTNMAHNNAVDYLEKTVEKIEHREDMTTTACNRLKDILGLKHYPKRMECYDISNISGVDKVGSMVVFTNGEKDSAEYRRFKIKTVEGANDFASLQEVLTRRIEKMFSSEKEKFSKPDLIIIDGGKGQLSSVKMIFDAYGDLDIDLISLAKKEELVYTTHSEEPIAISHRDYTLKLLQRIRDEAHHFAISYFRRLHEKRNLKSQLDDIEGIGDVKKKALFKHFGSFKKITEASEDELCQVDGIGKAFAKKIYDYFRSEEWKQKS